MRPERRLDWRERPGGKILKHSGKTSIAASGVRQKPAGTHEVNRFIPGFGFNLLHDSMDVVLDGELGQAKAGGDFFIRHSFGDQRHELALPKSQPGFQTSFLVGHYRLLTEPSRNMLKDRVSALREANIYEPQRYRHLVSSIKIVEEHGATLDLVANFLVVRTMQEGDMTLFAAGHYLDQVRLDDGIWKFARKTVVLDSRQIDTLLAIPI